MKDRFKGFFSGLIGGLIATACCITPLLFLLLGLGSIGLAASMGAYKMFFIFTGLLFIILTLANHIRMKAKKCACSSIQMLKQESKLILSAFASFFVIFGILNFILLPYITATISASDDISVKTVKTASLKQLKLKIDGMTCEGCAVVIESILENVKGVIDANVSFAKGTAIVLYDPSLTNPKQIISSVPKPYVAKIISG